MIILRQSTAGQEIPLGYFLDSTDGDTEETALTIANTDIKIWKFGATTLANKNSGGATHISNGIYYAVLDATDTNTVGSLVVFVHVAGALATRVDCVVKPANVYDSEIAGTDYLEVDAVAVSGDTTAADNLELDYDGTGYAKTNSTIGTCTTNTDMRGTDSAALAATALSNVTWTDARGGYLDELAAANIPADLDAVLADTNELQTDLTDGGRLDLLIDAIKAETDLITSGSAGGDGDTVTADSIADILRRLRWLAQNKMTVTDANGNTIVYKDNSTTEAFNVPGALTDDSTTTTRLRIA